jgi:serine/threonine-protein kinase
MVAASSSNIPTAPVKEGDILADKYRIENVIGVGGMGVVVSAMHLELEKRVALKFLLPQAQASDELIGRFMREAKASVKLKGIHVAQTLDVGRMDDGRAYIVMEYLDGRDLGQEIKAHKGECFPVQESVGWILQACEGLAEAHALGIVHRDLKPANLFLSRTDTSHVVKVLDFGISKSINPTSSDMLSLTKTEMLLGSPLYMAPEQMRSSKYVDERSDIWSLGAVAYELLSGHVPFEADTLLDLCFKVAQEDCVPLVERRPELPQALSDAVMRCLDKVTDGRWNDVGELATALEPFARPSDKGAAARTVAVLAAAGSRAPRPPRVESLGALPVSNARPGETSELRAKSEPPSSKTAPKLEQTAADDEPIPPSRAWGVPQESEPPKPNNSRSIFIIAGVGIGVLAISYFVSRGTRASEPPAATPPPPAVTTAVTTQDPPPPAPAPAPMPTPIVMPETPSAAASAPPMVLPRPRPKPVHSAVPANSGGFIPYRE